MSVIRRAGGLAGLAIVSSLLSCKEIRVMAVDVSEVSVSAPSTRLLVGESVRFTVRVTDAAGRDLVRQVVWTSDAPAIATVTSDGMVTGVGNGDAVITASVEGRADAVSVEVGDEPVATVEIQPSIAVLVVGDTLRMRLTTRAADGTELFGRPVTWRSTDTNVAEVGIDGLVRAESVGSVTISATVEGVRGQAGISVNASLMQVSSVRVDPSSATVAAGDSVKLNATALASNGAEIAGRIATWTSNNSAVATVSPTGMVRTYAAGTATISATIDGVSGDAVITVSPAAIASLSVTPQTTTLAVGGSLQFQATIRATDGSIVTGVPVTWSSDDPVIASVTTAGLVTGNAVGTAVIRASAAGVSGAATVFVVLRPIASLTISPANPTILVGDSILVDANPVDGNGSPLTGRQITWTAADPTIATVTSTGTLTQQARVRGLRDGKTYIRAEAGVRRDSTLVTVLPVADLVVTKTAPTGPIQAGDPIVFTLMVHNAGPSAAAAVVLTDTLPPNAPFLTATGGASLAGGVLTWPPIASLASGASQSFTVSVTAPSTGQVTNVGAAVSPTMERDSANNRASASVSIAAPDLRVTKTSTSPIVTAGEIIEFTIGVTNAGPSDATGVIVADTLPTNATFVDATGSPASSGNVLTWSVGSLAVGAAVQYTVRVTAPASGAVRNVATASATNGEAVPADNVAEVTVGVNALTDLAVSKTASVATVDAGGVIDYVVTVRNVGLSAAAAVVVTDTLPANAAFVNASGGPTVANGILTWTVPSIAPGDSVRFTVQVTAPKQGTVRNAAAATTSTAESSLANNAASASTTVNLADLHIVKSGPAAAAPASPVTYTIQVTNEGPGRADDVLVTDQLPTGATFVGASGGGSENGGVITWPVLASLTSGAPAVTYTVEIVAASTGPMVNVASVQASTADPDPTDDSSTVTTAIAFADLVVSKTGPVSVNAGETITYTLTVRNDGPTAAAGAILVDSLPAGVTLLGASVPPVQSGRELSWSLSTIANGAVVSIDVQVQAPAAATTLSNMAKVSAQTTDPDLTNNRATVGTTVVPVANLAISKTGPAQADPGATIDYVIDVTNAGPSAAAGVVVTDALPAGVTFVSASGSGQESGGTVTWPAAVLSSGQNLSYTVTVTLPATAGTYTNNVQVAAGTLDPDLNDNSASHATDVTEAELTVTMGGPATATAADILTYTVTVSNNGPSAAAAVVVTNTLPANATYIDSTPAGSLSGNDLTWNAPSLAAGSQLIFTVRVLGPAAGGDVTNVATAVSSTSDPVPANNSASVTTAVSPAADLAITKTASSTTVNAGDTITYTIEVTNLGPSDAAGVVVTDNLPGAVGFVDASNGGIHDGNGVVTWPAVPLQSGGSFSYTLRYEAGGSGSLTNQASVASTTLDPDATNNASSTTSTVATADLDVVIIAPSSVSFGSSMTYTVMVVNNGPGTAIGPTVQAAVATNSTYDSHSAGTRDAATGVITLTAASLASGQAMQFDVTVTPDGSGDIQMSASVNATTVDPNPTNDTANATTTLTTSAADLVVSVTASPSGVLVGQTVTYTITVQNNGPGDAVGLTLTAALPSAAQATFVGADGNPTKVGDTLTWQGLSLADGGSFSYDVEVTAAAAGVLVLTASANALNNDPKPADNTDSAVSVAS